MVGLLEIVRLRVAGRPLLLCLALAAAVWLVARRSPHRAWPASVTLGRTLATISLVALVAYAVIVVDYARDPHYVDPAEPTMTAIGWLFALGRPIYHGVDAAERYAHIYGPMAFIPHGVVLRLFGPSIGASKWLGAAAALLSLVCTFLALRRVAPPWRALTLTGACALAWLGFRHYTFWTRPEPLQLLCVSAGLLASVRARGVIGGVALGICAGLLWNLKITGPLYTLPLLVILWHGAGARATLAATGVAVAVFAWPFAALPNVSFRDYLTWVRLSSQNGLLLSMLRQNMEWAAFFLLPLLVSYYGARPDDRPRGGSWRGLIAALVVGIGGVCVAASKPGAGVYHLLPFLPIVAWATARALAGASLDHDRGARVLALSCAITACLIAIAQQTSFLTLAHARHTWRDTEDVRAFAASHPGAIVAMAYSGDDELTFVRPELVFASGSYLIDAPAVQEHQLSGVALPQATIDAVRDCRIDIWLVPRGAAPFEGLNRYPAMARTPLFSDRFRTAFHASYVRDGATRYFDIWTCRTSRAR
jgi:hypothetical protein